MALGGIGSALGAFLGGILLGIVEAFASFSISGAWADAISYTIFLIVQIPGFIREIIRKSVIYVREKTDNVCDRFDVSARGDTFYPRY